ncbi:NhaP-type Na+/H+ or K+/H+ antiporter [Oikeobacillus pervagus]|uniref:NhaP-type Na+/H+ or K+/H+ antiporter n=1 Tax=Oikeobacillus pervagus TaxID=1325931 RepID=A0AAJ1SW31_9BACI|nr:NhaP-type Na+/H+ or K+/H+ antiporter [Oikeobacillus pervagus]
MKVIFNRDTISLKMKIILITARKGRCLKMVWLFILFTVIVYSFMMVFILKRIHKPAKQINIQLKREERQESNWSSYSPSR